MSLTHLSLFSGIGGLDLAAEMAGFVTVGQCEWAEYPTKVLEKHWPDVARWKDVRDVTVEALRARGIGKITVLSGGFPCQPHSLIGKRMASGDERDLWEELARVIREVKPKWFVGENVRGLLSSESGRFFGRILHDLAAMGYSTGWCCYGANRVGAIHQRERVFIISHADGKRRNCMAEKRKAGCAEFDLSHSEAWRNDAINLLPDLDGFFADPISGIQRNDNGIPEGLDRLKCLGNAVVPQQAYPIFVAIRELEGI